MLRYPLMPEQLVRNMERNLARLLLLSLDLSTSSALGVINNALAVLPVSHLTAALVTFET